MKVLLNTTKTMAMDCSLPPCLECTQPIFAAEARGLMRELQRLDTGTLAKVMGLSPRLVEATQLAIAQWGEGGELRAPALRAFTGLVYKYMDPASWAVAEMQDAQLRLLILSGLYGVLRPLDLVAAYRLEMGCRLQVNAGTNVLGFWRSKLTATVNRELTEAEPILNLAAQEYAKALVIGDLKGPLISPVFKEIRADGTTKSAGVYAKMARGAMVRFIFKAGVKSPAGLQDFGEMGWEAQDDVPVSGPWLFTRAART